MPLDQPKSAKLYRMVMPGHVCPFGLKSKDLLERQGYAVEDHPLTTREETDAFKREHRVKTTPQTFIGGERIGGYDDLRVHFGKAKPKEQRSETSYQPVIAVFAMALLMSVAAGVAADFGAVRIIQWFLAFSICILALLKLQDIESYSTMFLNYDLLAQRWARYSYIYPFGEALAGILMIAHALIWIASPVAIFIGTIGAVSVIKAVYIEKRELKCACVGGGSRVPLGFLSLTENVMMVVMGVWMALA